MYYMYKGYLVRVIDGDTARFRIDLGFNVFIEETMRLLDIDTPEIRRPATDREIAKGKEASLHLEKLIYLYERDDGELTLMTDKDLQGKFGRYLVTIIGMDRKDGVPVNLNSRMVEDGYAKTRQE